MPLDAGLGLPAGENSYVLEEWQQRLCVKDRFGQSVEDLKVILGQGLSVRTAEEMNRSMAEHAEAYRVTQPLPPVAEEAELLVVTGNGKGAGLLATTRSSNVWPGAKQPRSADNLRGFMSF